MSDDVGTQRTRLHEAAEVSCGDEGGEYSNKNNDTVEEQPKIWCWERGRIKYLRWVDRLGAALAPRSSSRKKKTRRKIFIYRLIFMCQWAEIKKSCWWDLNQTEESLAGTKRSPICIRLHFVLARIWNSSSSSTASTIQLNFQLINTFKHGNTIRVSKSNGWWR